MTNRTDPARSAVMRAVRSKHTGPELIVRSVIHRLGYRFRLHRKDLPGSPDIVLPARKKIIFVHGCFWHGHSCRRGDRVPKANREYWLLKVAGNKRRDKSHSRALKAAGWGVLTVWECQIAKRDRLSAALSRFLD